MIHRSTWSVVLVLALLRSAAADLPSPRLDLVFPAGLSAGGTADLILQGNDLEGAETLVLGHPGLRAEFVKAENANRLHFKLTASPDVLPGTYDLFVAGRFGITNPRLLLVTRGLTDVPEVEPNNTVATAQSVPLNSAVDNHVDGNNQDFFKLPLKAGQRIVCDCYSARLETEMDALLALTTSDGRTIATNSDYYGRDPFLDVIVPADGDYVLEVRDLTYRNGYPYRLLIHDRPQIENAFPRAVQAGQTVSLSVLGRNLGAGSQRSDQTLADVPLDQVSISYTAPTDILPLGLYRFREHPLQHSVLPTAATCTLTGEQFTPFETAGVPLVITDIAPRVEQEPNDTKDQALSLTLPAIVSGRFDKPRDGDWYVFETDEQGGAYGFDVYAERIAGRSDPYLMLFDKDGNRIQELDDYGHRVGAFDGHLRDPSGQVNLPAKQPIRVYVQDRYQRGGPRAQYVLSIRKARPDFYAACIHSNPNVAGTTVWQGGAAYVDVVVHHVDGANQLPITVTAENLPTGVHVTPTQVFNDNRSSLVFWSDENAPPVTGPLVLTAVARDGDRELRRQVRPYTRAYQQVGSRPMREQWLAVRELAPYALRIEPERISIEAGKSANVKLVVTRYWSNFTGAVNFQPLNWPGFLQTSNGTISAGSNDVTLTIAVQAGTRAGDYTPVILGQAQVPFHKDPAQTTRPNTLVPMPSRPLTITVTTPPAN